METYSKITRFCLICNYVTRIIDPLASRCSKFRFKSLDQTNAQRRLEEIAEKEGVPVEDGGIEALIRCSEGDLRKSITFLQSAARLVGSKSVDQDGDEEMDRDQKAVTAKVVEDIAGVIPDDTIETLVKAMRPRGSGVAYAPVAKVVEDFVADGWSAGQVVTQVSALARPHKLGWQLLTIFQLYQTVVYDETIPDAQKNKIVMVFSEIDKRLVDGADEQLSILDLALRISNILAGKK
jgi:replication factor C subunit 2/4